MADQLIEHGIKPSCAGCDLIRNYAKLKAEVERLRKALLEIVDCEPPGSDAYHWYIAREALRGEG